MPTRLVHLVVDANDPAALARFWAGALGWVIADETAEEVDIWPAGYQYPDPSAVALVFVPVPEPKTAKDRVHLDLATTSAVHQAELVSRLQDLGAAPADIGQGDVPWAVLADPEGNEFCVLGQIKPARMITWADSGSPGAAPNRLRLIPAALRRPVLAGRGPRPAASHAPSSRPYVSGTSGPPGHRTLAGIPAAVPPGGTGRKVPSTRT